MSAIDTLDTAVLSTYLESHVEGFQGPLTVEKFSGGQSNPTFRVDAASGQYVLRRQPPGKLLKSAHAVDREYRVIAALQSTDVPVASVYHLCEDTAVIGSMFYLMEYCEGTVFWNPAVPARLTTHTKNPAQGLSRPSQSQRRTTTQSGSTHRTTSTAPRGSAPISDPSTVARSAKTARITRWTPARRRGCSPWACPRPSTTRPRAARP